MKHMLSHMARLSMYTLMRDKERRKEGASKVIQTNSNTAHPRQSFFLKKMSYLRCDSNPQHSTL